MFRRTTSLLLTAVLCLSMLPTATFAAQEAWTKPGNSDLNILNGGVMLNDGDDFYFVQGGMFVKSGDEVKPLSADNGRNLNLYDGYIYYTLGSELRRVSVTGGAVETVYTADKEIKQLYILGGEFKFCMDGAVYELGRNNETANQISEVPDISGFIPTRYGDIFLTGEMLDYTLWADGKAVLSGVSSCYTDSGYLAVTMDNQNYMAELSKLFNGFSAERDLKAFNIHGTIALSELLSPDEENEISEYNDNNELQFDSAALLREAGFTAETDVSARLMEESGESAEVTDEATQTLSDGQKNIVKRARQLTEIKWTPLENIYQWGQNGVFKAETTYTGVPYGQPVNCNGYIGYGVSLEGFASAALDNTSKLYTSYSTYNKVAPYYSTDCSGFVSYTWGLTNRKTTYTLTDVAEMVGDQSLYSLQVGDCLDRTSSHVVLVTGLTYASDGSIIGIEISEETPVITRVTKYGEGQSKSLNSFQSYYLNGGFVIYRNPERDSVTYTPSAAVPLDGETVEGMKEAAPKSHTSSVIGGKSVTLTSDTSGAAIYYTLDGSAPTENSTEYTGAITVYSTTKLRAIAVSGSYTDSTILEYTIKVPPASAPTATVTSGLSSGNIVSSGAQLKLSSTSSGTTIYYTTDGTEPSTSGKTFSSPITITADTSIKALAVAPGMSRSQIVTLSYKVGAVYTITASAKTGGSISPSGSSSVLQSCSKTFSVKASDGYAVSDVLVDGASVGAVSNYTFKNVTSNHTISVSFKSTAQMPFTDVATDAWYNEAVRFAYAQSLFNGTSATTFSPETTMTRGMFITVLGRFAGISGSLSSGIGVVTGTGVNIRSGPSTDTEVAGVVKNKYTAVQVLEKSGSWYSVQYDSVTGYIRGDLIEVYSGNYTDLESGIYYSPYAEWAFLTGIAEGAAGTATFSADDSITREDMCLMLYNYAVIYGKTLPQTADKAAFSDDSAISHEAVNAVYALQRAEIVNGMGDGSFSPDGTATRAQVAQIYMKFVNAVS